MWATMKKSPASFFPFPLSPAAKAGQTNKKSSSTRPSQTSRLMMPSSNFQQLLPSNSFHALPKILRRTFGSTIPLTSFLSPNGERRSLLPGGEGEDEGSVDIDRRDLFFYR